MLTFPCDFLLSAAEVPRHFKCPELNVHLCDDITETIFGMNVLEFKFGSRQS